MATPSTSFDGCVADTTAETTEVAYAFGEYRFMPSRQLLLRGGTPVRVGSRALDLLHLLVKRQGELVSKEQLTAFAWPETFVHEGNLKVNVGALRRAISPPQSALPYIATVPGRGYRFVSPVRVEALAATPTTLVPAWTDNLPPPCELYGREDDIAVLAARLPASGFLTIAGPPGVGKTALAVEISRRMAADYADGVCFVDLALVGDPRLVCPAIIAAAQGGGRNPADTLAGLVESLRGKRRLLILDTCEHVLNATCMVAEHLHAALPAIGILATSREPLRSQFETVHLLAPLACAATTEAKDRDSASAASPALALFLSRAKDAAGYEPTAQDAPVIAEICLRLDGIPLALELAAPHLASEGAASLLRRLNQGFDVLSYGPRAAPARHQALLSTLDWSYRLLSDRDATTLRLLSIFTGGFTLDDAIGVAAPLGLSADEISRSVANLAAKSLLASRFVDGRLQYGLLNATRSYATERLRHAGESAGASASHAALMVRIFERAERERTWRAAEDWTYAYSPWIDDLRQALAWAAGEDGATALRLSLRAAAGPVWDDLAQIVETRRRVDHARHPIDTCERGLRDRTALPSIRGHHPEETDADAGAAWQETHGLMATAS